MPDMNIRALPEIVSRKDVPVPIWMFGGEQEAWLLPNKPTADNETGNSLRIWAWHQPYDARDAGRFLDRLDGGMAAGTI